MLKILTLKAIFHPFLGFPKTFASPVCFLLRNLDSIDVAVDGSGVAAVSSGVAAVSSGVAVDGSDVHVAV